MKDELDCCRRVRNCCGETLVRRISELASLSANIDYEVHQLSLKMVHPTTDTAAASLFVRLKDKNADMTAASFIQVSHGSPGHHLISHN